MFGGEIGEDALVLRDGSPRNATLALREGDNGPEAIGAFGGLQLRLRAQPVPGRSRWTFDDPRWKIEARVGIWGPSDGLVIYHKQCDEPDGHALDRIPTKHPILSRTVVVRSHPHPLMDELLEDEEFVSHLLSIVHQHPGSSIEAPWITLKMTAEVSPHQLELLHHMVFVGKALEQLAMAMRAADNANS